MIPNFSSICRRIIDIEFHSNSKIQLHVCMLQNLRYSYFLLQFISPFFKIRQVFFFLSCWQGVPASDDSWDKGTCTSLQQGVVIQLVFAALDLVAFEQHLVPAENRIPCGRCAFGDCSHYCLVTLRLHVSLTSSKVTFESF